jgi:spermidine synthase
MGAAFPFLAAGFVREGRTGATTGQLLTINTFAGVLGSLAMAFLCLPVLGQQGSYYAIALLLGAVSVVCGAASVTTWTARAALTLAPALVLALVVGLPRDTLSRAHFRTGSHVFAIREGSTTTAAAALRMAYGQPYYAELLTPGVSMSSTAPHARRYMAMLAHAALFSASGNDRALLICYGVGNTASALLSHPRLKRLDVVDISREVLSLAPRFARALGSHPLTDPRVHVYVDDGRHHLIVEDARYDVITAEPPPPNHAGVVNLYSREFYRLAARRLAPGGVISQWLPVFELSDDEARAMIAAFVAELPHAALLYGYKEHLILLGSQQPLAIDTARAREAARDPVLAYNLKRSGIGDLDDVLGSVVMTDAELRREARGVRPVTDERPSIQYPYENVRVDTSYAGRLQLTAAHAFALLGPSADPQARASVAAASRATAAAISVLPVLRPEVPAEWTELELGNALYPVLRARPNNAGLWNVLGLDSDHVKAAEAATASSLPSAQRTAASWVLMRRAFYAGDYARALTWLDAIRPDPEEVAQHALLRAGCLRALGRANAARLAFAEAAEASHDVRFKAAATALAAAAESPFAPERGPFSTNAQQPD